MRLALLLILGLCCSSCESKPSAIRGRALLSIELQRTLKPTATLYVIGRKPGELQGAPAVVKRYGPPLLFPVDYSLSEQDIGAAGGNLVVSARISQAGPATPVSEGDIEGYAQAPFVPMGTQGVDVTLDQTRR